jgi:predicted dehydrogenase
LKKELKIGFIGCGRIASILEDDKLRIKPATHAGGISHIKGLKIVAASDIDEKRLNKFGKKWNVSNLYLDYKKMIKSEKLDIVVVAAWSHLHKEMVLYSLNNTNIKGIVCEKPLAISLKDAKKMVLECKKKNVHLMINHERRFDSKYENLKNFINNNEIGEIKTVTGNVLTGIYKNIDKKKYGGGPLLHDGTHLIDILLYLFGDIKAVKGEIKKGKTVENIATAFIKFKNKINCFIEAGGERNYFNFELDIFGTKGRIKVGNGLLEVYKVIKSTRYEGFFDLKKVDNFLYDPTRKGIIVLYEEMKNLILNKSSFNRSSGEDSLKSIDIIFKIYKNEMFKK